MAGTAVDLSAIRTDALESAASFRALIGVYSQAEVGGMIPDVSGFATQADIDAAINSIDLSALARFNHRHDTSAIVSGTIAEARLSSNVPLKNAANTYSAIQTFSQSIFAPTGRFSSSVWIGGASSNNVHLYANGSGLLQIYNANESIGHTLDVSQPGKFRFRNTANSQDEEISAGLGTFSGPIRSGVYTFATRPTATSYPGSTIVLSDRNYRAAKSNGVNWVWADDETTIAT